MATLELRNVNKTYGSGLPDTLKDIQLSIKDGEFLILVSPAWSRSPAAPSSSTSRTSVA